VVICAHPHFDMPIINRFMIVFLQQNQEILEFFLSPFDSLFAVENVISLFLSSWEIIVFLVVSYRRVNLSLFLRITSNSKLKLTKILIYLCRNCSNVLVILCLFIQINVLFHTFLIVILVILVI